MAKVFVPKERSTAETRVAATPETVKKLCKEGLEVWVEKGAGFRSHLPDANYEEAGAKISSDPSTLWREADAILKVGPLAAEETSALKSGAIVIGLLTEVGTLFFA